ncbi:hypothetical protein [Streptomyces sp. NBC_01445]|uniref:hypothetical protein n=1 Tax=Streptomyces sp. NBC_01445 TaxID=2903869 RepID=UPI003FA3790F
MRFQDLYDEPFVATPAESGAWRDYWLATDEREGPQCVSARSPTTPMNGSTRSPTTRTSASLPKRPPAFAGARTSSTGP